MGNTYTNEHGDDWIYVDGYGKLNYAEAKALVEAGRIKETVRDNATGNIISESISPTNFIQDHSQSRASDDLRQLASQTVMDTDPWEELKDPNNRFNQMRGSNTLQLEPQSANEAKTLRDYAELLTRKDFEEKSKQTEEDKEKQRLRDQFESMHEPIIDFDKQRREQMYEPVQQYDDKGYKLNEKKENPVGQIYNYLKNTEGREAAEKYYKDITPELNRENREKQDERIYQQSYDNPIAGAALSLATAPLKPFELAAEGLSKLATGKIDENDPMFSGTRASQAAMAGASKRVGEAYAPVGKMLQYSSLVESGWTPEKAKEYVDSLDNNLFEHQGQFGFNTAYSIAEFAYNLAIGNALAGNALLTGAETTEAIKSAQKFASNIALFNMSSGAASSTVLEAKDEGMSDEQALILGGIAGFAEWITEKFSVEAWLDPEKSLLKGDTFKYIIKNMAAEGSEEFASDMINLVGDILVKGDKSDFSKRTQELKAEGKSDAEAFGIWVGEKLMSAGESALGGAISGLVMGTVGGAKNYVNSNRMVNYLDLNESDTLNNLIEEGLSQEGTLAQELAQRLQQTQSEGRPISNTEIAGLYNAIAEEKANEEWRAQNEAEQQSEIKQFLDEAAVDMDDGALYILEEMHNDEPVSEYVTAMNDYYLAGQRGEDINSVYTDSDVLNESQKQAIYDYGKGESNGVHLSESTQRSDGESTEKSVPSMEEETGRVSEGESEAPIGTDAEVDFGKDYKSSEVVPDGNDKSVKFVDPSNKNYKSVVDKAKKRGYTLRLIDSNLGITDDKGTYETNGWINTETKEVFGNVNDPDMTIDQIIDHEFAHDDIASGVINMSAVIEELGDINDDIARDYEAAYDGITMSPEELAEEFVCDAVAGINRFKGRLTTMEQKYTPVLKNTKKSVEKNTQKANAPPKSTTKASVAMSKDSNDEKNNVLEYDTNGNKVSKDMQEYMKNSYAREDFTKNSPLKVMYHGTQNGLFTQYKISDNIGYYFTDDIETAQSYSNDYSDITPDRPMKVPELKRFVEDITNNKGSVGVETINKKIVYEYTERNKVVDKFNSLKDLQEYVYDTVVPKYSNYTNYYTNNAGIYSAYLNCENPLFIDARNSNWDDIQTYYFELNAKDIKEKRERFVELFNKSDPDLDTHPEYPYEDEQIDYHLNKTFFDIMYPEASSKEKRQRLSYSLNKWYEQLKSDGSDGRLSEKEWKEFRDIAKYLDEMQNEENIEDAPYEYMPTKDIETFAHENGYDSVIIKNVFDNGGIGVAGDKSTVIIVYEPEQIKSIYNEHPTTNPDFRHSAVSESYKELTKENKAIQKELQETQKKLVTALNELKITDKLRVRSDDIEKFSQKLIKEYASNLPVAKVRKMVSDFGNYILTASNDNTLSPEEFSQNVKIKAVNLANQLIGASKELLVNKAEYKGMLNQLLSRSVSLAPEYQDKIPYYNTFRENNRRNVKISQSGMPVSQAYDSLSKMYPDWFPATITDPAEQLMRMAEVGEYMQPKFDGMKYYGAEYSAIIEKAANDIISDAYGSLRATNPTFADIQEQNYKKMEHRFKEQIADLKTKMESDIKSLKRHYAEKERVTRERRNAKLLRERIERHVKALSNKLLNPTDKKHFSEVRENGLESMRSIVAKVLSVINLESNFEVTEKGGLKHYKATSESPLENGEARYNQETGKWEYINNAPSFPTKRTEAFRELKSKYLSLIETGEFITDEALSATGGLLEQIADLESKPITSLGVDDLTKLMDCITSLENTIDKYDKLTSVNGEISEWSKEIINYNADKEAKQFSFNPVNNLFLGMRTPQAFFERLGEYGEKVFKLLRKGQNNQFANIRTVKDFYWELKNKYKFNERSLDKQMVTVTLGGKEVTIPITALMDLYVASKRAHALDDITEAGVRIKQRDGLIFSKGYLDLNNVKEEELNRAFSSIPKELKTIADELQRYASEDLADMGNEASMRVFGYKKFNEDNYWHINIDPTQRRTKVDTYDGTSMSVGNKGMSIPVNPKAVNKIDIQSIFDSFYEHCVDMCNYAAFLDVMEDVNRIRTYAYYDDNDVRHSVAEVVNKVHGNGGMSYWNKLMSDLANGVKSEKSYFGNNLGRFKAAAVGANLRVIIQQPTAVARALGMMKAKYFLAASMNVKKGMEEAQKYSNLAWWKSQGYFDMNTGPTLKNLLLGSETKLDKVNEVLMAGASFADDVAWGYLWNAVKAEIKDTTGLNENSQEFFDRVVERFEDIIDKTQVVDGVLQRPEILRSSNGLVKMATAFMGEPLKQLNQAVTAVQNYLDNRTSDNLGAVKNTAIALLLSGALNAAAKSIVDAIRHSKREKDYWEQFVEEFTGWDGENLNFMDSNLFDMVDLPQYIPFVKDYEEVFRGYDVKRTDMSTISDAVKAWQKFEKSKEKDGFAPALAFKNAVEQTAKLFGVPAYNLDRDITAIVNTILVHTLPDEAYIKYAQAATPVSSNKSTYYSAVYDAYSKGDTQALQTYIKALNEAGVDNSKIQSEVRKKQRDALELQSVNDIPSDKKFTIDKTTGEVTSESGSKEKSNKQSSSSSDKTTTTKTNSARSEYEKTSLWKQASEGVKTKFDKRLSKLDSTEKDDSVLRLQYQTVKARQLGYTEKDWMMFTLARDIVDASGISKANGYYDDVEERKAAEMIGMKYSDAKTIKESYTKDKKNGTYEKNLKQYKK